MKNIDKFSYMPGNGNGNGNDDNDDKTDSQTQDWWKFFF
jgi:hypothetical protein